MGHSRLVYKDLPSPLGPMIGGASENGLCLLEWHDRGGVDRIRERVIKRYKCDLASGTNRHLDQLESDLVAYFAGELTEFSAPIDVTGTAFEQEVWRELLKIPFGATRSYGEMAAIMGKPGAARAVGRANGANYLAIVIPCHRVIDASGGLHGYGGGLHRKKHLLELEARVAGQQRLPGM
ncbi:MAG: methylated-DNA--[protein]-cysteine S-methyltransferase [bacterium]